MNLTPVPQGYSFTFRAMGSPCELRVDTDDNALALRLGEIGEAEAARIERKYSRYLPDSVVSRINGANGEPVALDPETVALIDYAARCHQLSDGRFDITSGALRRVWRFDGSDRVPTRAMVREILAFVGWDKAVWASPELTLLPGMEIDFGGLGKEYAVDTALLKIEAVSEVPVLVNFGGDLRVSGPRRGSERWRVSIEAVDPSRESEALLEVSQGALATSGDVHRYLLKNGVRYGHILDPRTGWPVRDAPRSVTVAADTCMEAGILSTLAMLHGAGAEAFLKREKIQAWWVG